MTNTTQYSKSFYKWLYAALIACSLNGILRCIVFFTKKRISPIDQIKIVIWVVVPLVLIFMIYQSKKSTPISYSEDGIRYKQGLMNRFIPISQIAEVVADERGVTIFGKKKEVIKNFNSKHYHDLEFLETRYKQRVDVEAVNS